MAATPKTQAGAPNGGTATRRSAVPPSVLISVPHGRVAERAYEIWQASGRPNGHDQDNWFQAERELSTSPFALRTPPR